MITRAERSTPPASAELADMTDNYVWKPSPAVVEYSNVGRFMRRHRIATLPGADCPVHGRDRVVLAGGGRGSGDRVFPAV